MIYTNFVKNVFFLFSNILRNKRLLYLLNNSHSQILLCPEDDIIAFNTGGDSLRRFRDWNIVYPYVLFLFPGDESFSM